MDITIKYDDHEVTQALTRLQAKLGDLTPAMRDIGELVLLSVKRNFEDAGRPTKWPLSRRVKEHGGQTLSDTGRLRNSMTSKAGADQVTIGTNVIYAAIHHFGGKIRPKTKRGLMIPGMKHPLQSVTMPARPFLMIQDQDRGSILRIIERYLLQG